ncbi:MAG: M48 family peptidase [Desulfobulbaceae bacterium]|nr:MAG: M48 family peptidase [Desulfobulbaceae bacterium]
MNYWLLLILLFIFFNYFLSTIVSICNLQTLHKELPDEFSDTFDNQSYLKSQRYTKATTSLSLVESTLSVIITICFIILGGFNLVDQFARSLGFSEIVTGLIFTGTLLLLSLVLSLPFSIISTFYVEERFGFNRTTPLLFVTDLIKGIGLTIFIGGPILWLILILFEIGGQRAWIYCWAGVVIISFVLQFLAPVLIMPLFNKFTPLASGTLKDKIESYADAESFAIQGIFTMDGSKRSAKLNAFFTGFGKFRKIVFFDTLLEKLNDDEILAVLAHEMGHFKKRHIWFMMILSVLQTGLIFFFLSLILKNEHLFDAFGMEHLSTYASLVFFGFLYSPLSTFLSLVINHFSRKHEFQADQYAAETTGSGDRLISGLKKLSLENLSNITPHPLTVFITYSHPPVLMRIAALRKLSLG